MKKRNKIPPLYWLFFLMLACLPLVGLAQAESEVRGQVKDSTGLPLQGVNILVKGTNIGVQTGVDGSFAIQAKPGSVLVISFTGYIAQQIAVKSLDFLSIQLLPDAQSLDQVVVVGYGTQQKRNLTGAVATVKGDVVGKQPVAGVEQALQGQVAGVQVTTPSGQPGSGMNVQIRGNNSISAGSSPLFVIDGVPVSPSYDGIGAGEQTFNPLNTINPNDIESIDILKDGAAAAIYGVRASNGVVVITTKRGKGKGEINFNAYYGVQSLRKKIDLLNGPQWADLYNEALESAGLPPVVNQGDIKYSTDWQDEIFRNAPIQNYQLSVGGANERSRYYLSAGYFDQQGIVMNSGIKRYQVKLNLEQSLGSNIKVGTNMNFSQSVDNRSVLSGSALNNGGVLGGALSQIPLVPVKTEDGKYGTNPYLYSDNPVGNLVEIKNKANIYQFIGNVYGEVNFLPNLTFRTNLAMDFTAHLAKNFTTLQYSATQNNVNKGSAEMYNAVHPIGLWENTLTWQVMDQADHHLTVLAGYSAQRSKYSNQFNSSAGFVSNEVTNFVAGRTIGVPTSKEEEWGLTSYFARAIYNMKGRYLLQASLRADGSSVFNKENRYGYFPAVSAGWIISEEAFFNQTNAFNFLKLRASAGSNGNQQVGTYARYTLFRPGQAGTVLSQIGNNELKWETTTQYNLGIDAAFVNNRIAVSLDMYQKRTRDLLQWVPLPTSVGVATAPQNVGTVDNKGFELGITSTNIQEKNFKWNTNFNFSINRNKVVDLGKVLDSHGEWVDRKVISGNNIIQKGESLGVFYGHKVVGVFQNQAAINAAPTQDNAKPGDLQFLDLNNDGVINDQDRTIIGNPNPRFIAALTNNLTIGGFDVLVFFQGSFGNDIFHANRQLTEGMSSAINATTATLHRWQAEGDKTNMPRAVIGDPNYNNRASDRFIEKGTYVRLKNLTVGYTIPSTRLEKIGIRSLRLYATGQNLLTFTNYSGWDPEVSFTNGAIGFGVDYFVYPQSRSFLVGLNVKF